MASHGKAMGVFTGTSSTIRKFRKWDSRMVTHRVRWEDPHD